MEGDSDRERILGVDADIVSNSESSEGRFTPVEDDGVEPILRQSAPSAYELHRRRQRRIERITLGVAGLFVLGIIALVVFSDSEPVKRIVSITNVFTNGGGASNNALNCKDPEFSQTAACRERESEMQSSWRGIVRNADGKSNPFAVHGRD